MTSPRSSNLAAPESRKRSIILFFLNLIWPVIAITACSDESKKDRFLERGQKYFAAGEYEKATIEYLNALRKDFKNAAAYRQLGIISLENGATLRAASYLRKSLELEPNHAVARTKLTLALLELSGSKELRDEAVKLFTENPSSDEAVLLLAKTAVSREDVYDSEQQLLQLEKPDRVAVHVALSGLAARRRDVETMEKEAQTALSLDAKSVDAHLCMANLRIAQGDFPKAGESFKTAADLAPPRSPAHIQLAEFKLATGAASEAQTLLQDLSKKVPDYLPAWLLQAQMARLAGKYDESLSMLDKVLAQDPLHIDARLMQAQNWLTKSDPKKAISLLEDLRSQYPKFPIMSYNLALAHLQDRNVKQARVDLDQALYLNPDYQDAMVLQAQVELSSGDPKRAVDLLQGVLNKRPSLGQAQTHGQAQTLLAEAFRTLGQFDDAAKVLRQQIKANPKKITSYIMLGRLLRQKGALQEAREAFGKAQELAPDDLLPTLQLVEMDLRDKAFAAAHQRVAVHLQKNPKLASAQVLEGRILAAEGKWDEAEATFLRTLELNANESSVDNELIGLYVASGRLPQAIAKLEAQLAKNPADARALSTSAALYEANNEFPKARDAYEKLLTVDPASVKTLNNLACLYALRLEQVDKAYELASKARAINATDPRIADTLGWILYKRRDYAPALALLTESASKLPDNPEVQYHLGMTAYMMGRSDVAMPALKMAAAAPSDFPGKSEIKFSLALLEGGSGSDSVMSLSELEASLQKYPDDVLLLTRLAQAHEKEGALEKAAAAYERTLQLNPKLSSSCVNLARLYAGPLKKPDLAMKHALKARDLAPNDPRAAAVLGSITYAAGDYAKAYGLLRESADGLPDDPAVLHDFAWAAYSQGKVEDARKSMQHLLKVAPTTPQLEDAKTFVELTALDPGSKDLVASASKVDGVLQKSPAHMPALMARAAIHMERGETMPAIETYDKVLAKFPDFSPAQKWLAKIYAADPANVQKAYDLATKARKSLPEDPDLTQTLAVLAYHRKEFPYAIQLLNESAGKRPLDAKSLYYLGKSYLAGRKLTEGKSALEKSLAANLEEPLAADAKATLRRLP